MRLFIYSQYIAELDMRDYYPIIEPAKQKYLDRKISPRAVLRGPFLSADQAGIPISRLYCERPCAGFVEYFLDFFGGGCVYDLKTHGVKKFKGDCPGN